MDGVRTPVVRHANTAFGPCFGCGKRTRTCLYVAGPALIVADCATPASGGYCTLYARPCVTSKYASNKWNVNVGETGEKNSFGTVAGIWSVTATAGSFA